MTQEQIKEAAGNYSGSAFGFTASTVDAQNRAFITGAKWRIESVWHKPDEQPKRNRVYLAQMGEEAFDTFYDSNNWESFSKGLNITRWAYIEDLLPEDNK